MFKFITRHMTMLAVVVFLGGCGANHHSIYRSHSVNGGEAGDVSVALIDAKQRAIFSQRSADETKTMVCSEPSPDVFSVLATSLGASASVSDGKTDIGAAFASATNEAGSAFGLRTQTITTLRDMMFYMCQYHMSGAVEKADVRAAVHRQGKLLTAILAIEQLTGATQPSPIQVTAKGGGNVNVNVPAPNGGGSEPGSTPAPDDKSGNQSSDDQDTNDSDADSSGDSGTSTDHTDDDSGDVDNDSSNDAGDADGSEASNAVYQAGLSPIAKRVDTQMKLERGSGRRLSAKDKARLAWVKAQSEEGGEQQATDPEEPEQTDADGEPTTVTPAANNSEAEEKPGREVEQPAIGSPLSKEAVSAVENIVRMVYEDDEIENLCLTKLLDDQLYGFARELCKTHLMTGAAKQAKKAGVDIKPDVLNRSFDELFVSMEVQDDIDVLSSKVDSLPAGAAADVIIENDVLIGPEMMEELVLMLGDRDDWPGVLGDDDQAKRALRVILSRMSNPSRGIRDRWHLILDAYSPTSE